MNEHAVLAFILCLCGMKFVPRSCVVSCIVKLVGVVACVRFSVWVVVCFVVLFVVLVLSVLSCCVVNVSYHVLSL